MLHVKQGHWKVRAHRNPWRSSDQIIDWWDHLACGELSRVIAINDLDVGHPATSGQNLDLLMVLMVRCLNVIDHDIRMRFLKGSNQLSIYRLRPPR
jgi:hypothetical protein